MKPATTGLAVLAASLLALASVAAAKGSHVLEASLQQYHFDYKEDLPAGFKSNEEGWLPGIRLGYDYHGQDNPAYVRLVFEYTDADTDYDGTIANLDGTAQTGIPFTDVTDNTFVTWEGNIGYTFRKSLGPFRLTPYTGLGYRYWDRSLHGPSPFSEEYSWWYIPAGFQADFEINDRWSGTLDVCARLMFGGKIQVNLGEINPLLNSPEVDLGNEPGVRVELPFRYRPNGRLGFSFAPWYEYSSIDRSDSFLITLGGSPFGQGYEPASDTHQYGMRLGVNVSF